MASLLLYLNKVYALRFILTLNMYLAVWKIKLKVQSFEILEKVTSSLVFLSFIKRIAWVCSYITF